MTNRVSKVSMNEHLGNNCFNDHKRNKRKVTDAEAAGTVRQIRWEENWLNPLMSVAGPLSENGVLCLTLNLTVTRERRAR